MTLTSVGATQRITPTITPDNATNKGITYSSSDTSIATVGADGTVRAVSEGTATITATTDDGGKTATCTVMVSFPSTVVAVTGVSVSPTKKTIKVGETLQLEVTVSPQNATNKAVTYVSDKPSVATVSETGLVKAKAAGKATITVTTEDSGKTASCVVTVIKSGGDGSGGGFSGGGSSSSGGIAVITKPDYKPGILTDEHCAYIVGRAGRMIAPEEEITRAEVATIIYRLLAEEVRNKAKTVANLFTDVNEGDWFNTAVSTLASLELIKGRTADSFAPNAFITRAELATILARMVEVQYDGKTLFSDISGHWAENEINEAVTAEWILGYNGLFRPDDNITRAETMTLINRVLHREPESRADLLDGMTTWQDNADENAWYYLAVQEATNSHTHKMKADGKHEKWTSMRENPDWSNID